MNIKHQKSESKEPYACQKSPTNVKTAERKEPYECQKSLTSYDLPPTYVAPTNGKTALGTPVETCKKGRGGGGVGQNNIHISRTALRIE